MARRSEQGSVLGFVLVGAVLAALLVGGIYVVRQIVSTQNGSGDDSKIADSNTESEQSKHEDNDSENSTSQEQLQKELESQANQQKQANNSGNGNSSQSSQAGGSATNLPATGPEDSLVMAIGATLLVGVGVSYTRSRQLI